MLSKIPNLISSLMISNEAEDVSGRTSAEIERVLYVRVGNFDFLDKANSAERQEQWSVKVKKTEDNAGSGSIRVRKSINLRETNSPPQYVLATKLDVGEKGSTAETPEQSTADQFRIFKYFGEKGMIKDRYSYDIPNTDLRWEVDCFPKEGAMYHEWLKLDLEKWPRGKELPALPFEVLEMIDGSPGYLTEENESKVRELYETMFLTPNQMQPLASYDDEEEESQQDNPNGTATDEEGQQKANDQTQGNNDDGQQPGGEDPDAGGNQDPGSAGGGEGGDAGGKPEDDGNDDDDQSDDD